MIRTFYGRPAYAIERRPLDRALRRSFQSVDGLHKSTTTGVLHARQSFAGRASEYVNVILGILALQAIH